MTAALTEPVVSVPEASRVDQTAENTLAPWWPRALALAVDVLPGSAVLTVMGLTALSVPLGGVWWWSCVSVGGLVVLLTAGNRALLPAVTGWSLGRSAMGIAVVRNGAGSAAPSGGSTGDVGPWRLLLRDLAHLLDTASLFVGWLWPLWDQHRRTFADMLLHTEVRRTGERRSPRSASALVALAFLAAALLCLAGAGVSYGVVNRQGHAADQTRTEVAAKGSTMVAEMLSYHPETLQDDFAHARSLVTDNYREQLEHEQQAVQSGKPVLNEYWVTNSAVLSATGDRATVLMFMQGLRGDEEKQRPISATLRVLFVKPAEQWRIDDLTVLTKPAPTGGGN